MVKGPFAFLPNPRYGMASISIKHLNDDTSWLITFRESDESKPFNLVIDPWLCGDQYTLTRWFQGGVHLVEPCFPSLPALEREHGDISAILTSIGLTDHTHPNTLFTSRPSVPVFGSKTALSVIDGLHHFDHPAVETRSWDGRHGDPSPDTLRSLVEAAGWGNAEQYDLFDRVSVLYIPLGSRGFLMGATVITFQLGNLDDTKTYSVVYTPHGSSVATLQATVDSLNTLPHHECLAIISNFDLVHTPPFGLAQPGKENGLILLKLLNPKFWLRTHDGRKEAKNFIGYFMTSKKYEIEDIRKEIQGETQLFVLESGQSQQLL